MEERERQARKGAGGRAAALARWVPLPSAVALVALAVTTAPAGGGVATSAPLGADVAVEARDDFFMPSSVTINPGETVTWTNLGSNPHNVHFQDGFDQPPDPEASAWTRMRRFDVPGSYSYRCDLHATMTGTVNVVAPPPGTPPPGGGTPPPGGGTPPPGGGTPPPGGGTPPPGGGNPPPGGLANTTVTLQVSDATPARGARVRFFGTVRPARDGRLLQLQRRSRGGSYVTVSRIRLRDAGSTRSKFSKRLRVLGDAMFRARLPADSAHQVGVSRAKRLNVP
jgi:plastocyanin